MEKEATIAPVAPSPRLLALTKVLVLVTEIRKEAEPHLVALSDEERQGGLPVPVELPKVGAQVLQAAAGKPMLPKLVIGYHPDLIAQLLAEAVALAELGNQLESLARAVGDTRNTGLAAAFRSLLELYHVAKPLAESDVSYVPIARPLATLFEERSKPKGKKGKAEAEAKTETETEVDAEAENS